LHLQECLLLPDYQHKAVHVLLIQLKHNILHE
jgi:hypothetical protein